MIPTLIGIGLINLRRDRVVQAMTFFLPIVFFSIFAGVFGSQGRDTVERVRVAVVDEDQTSASKRLVAALQKETSLRVRTAARPAGSDTKAPEVSIDRARATAMVRDGDIPVAIVIPEGFGATFGSFDGTAKAIELLSDSSDPIASQVVSGMLQKTAMTAAPDLMARQGLGMFEKHGGALTPQQKQVMDSWYRTMDGTASPDSAGAAPDGAPAAPSGPGGSTLGSAVEVRIVDVLGEKKANPLISFYAAGIAVMFLLFSASGAGGTLIEEVESGTLERLLTSRAGMGTVLAAKWLFITLLGVLQIVVMFVWGMLVFELDLLPHLPGFFVMTFLTAGAAAGFGLVLATLCKSRQQLGGLSTILILTQSALGGSMFPRFLMPDGIKKIGNFTFNAHALDGYQAVFWRDARLIELWPQVLILAALTLVFMTVARLLARRWETV
jgi:ABC-2 type transport system permease protein